MSASDNKRGEIELRAPTLLHLLRDAAVQSGESVYLNVLGAKDDWESFTFRTIWERSARFARFLNDRGLRKTDRVVLLLPNSDEFVVGFFGTLLAGGIPAPCPLPAMGALDRYVATLAPIVRSAKPAFFVTVERAAEPAKRLMAESGRAEGVVVVGARDLGTGAGTGAGAGAENGADDIALIQYTSGKLNAPTGVTLTHQNVLSNIAGFGRALALSDRDIGLSWVPLVHDMGLIGGLLSSLYYRYPLNVMPPEAFLMRPQLWLQHISRLRATVSAAPNFAYALCTRRVTDKHLDGVDLSSWRLALSGAETVRDETVQAFAKRFAAAGFSARAICPIYGLAENSLAATCPSLDESYVTEPLQRRAGDDNAGPFAPETGSADVVVSVGYALQGQEVAVVDEGGAPLAEALIGEVVVRGPCVMRGYFENEEATRRVLSDGSLRTGDLGFLKGGRLFITGRKKEMVIKAGRNYYPADIEPAVEAVTKTKAVAFALFNHESGTEDLVVIVESAEAQVSPEAQKKVRADMNSELLSTIGIRADRIVLAVTGSLPDGDRDERRRVCRDRYREEALG